MLSTANQAYVFLSTVYAGFVIGFIYDCYRMLRKIMKPGHWLTGCMDMVFWLIMGVLSFLVIFFVNNGEVRLYTIAGLAIGWGLYVLVLSPYVMKVLQFIYDTLVKLITTLLRIVFFPFKLMYKIVAPPVRWMIRCLAALVVALKKTLARIRIKNYNKNIKGKEEF